MSHLEGSRSPHFSYYEEPHTHTRIQQIVSTIAFLLLGSCALTFFNAWPSSTKRIAYEATIRFIPSRFIYLLQNIMMRFGGLADQGDMFRRDQFGNFKAKEEALERMVGSSPIPNVLQRARTLSGYDKIVPLTKELGPPGLGNWDNSCYQNSVLQGLASLNAFQQYIDRSLLLCEKARVSSNTTSALATFLDQLSDTMSHKQTLWTPKVLKSMDSWQQQDAQEYFSRILEAAEKEAIRYTNVISRSSDLGLNCLRATGSKSSVEKEKAVRKLLQTLVGNPMDGLFAQALTCQACSFSEGVSLTQFNCLTLNLGLGGQRSLEQLLNEYTAPELIEGVECDNCTRIAHKRTHLQEGNDSEDDEDTPRRTEKSKVKKELRTKAKQITFGRLPKDMVVHINRSIFDDYGNQVKNPSLVQYPMRWEFLNKWSAPLEAGSESVQAVYELKCVVTHSGRHDNGHYVAYGKRDKDWFCFNDELVTKSSEQQALTRGNVFMLFYEALDPMELAMLEEELNDEREASAAADMVSNSTSSAESETYEEPLTNPLRVSIPAMRTASGGPYPNDSENPLHIAFVPAL